MCLAESEQIVTEFNQSSGRETNSVEAELYQQFREKKLHHQPGFAYDTYLCTIPVDFPRVELHWHPQFEVIYIKKGRGVVSVNLTSYPVEAKCIVPVLPGELHAISAEPGIPMEYENIIFSLDLLDCTEGDDWCRQVLKGIREGRLIFPRPICPGTPFHARLAAALDGADEVCERREEGYPLLVKSQLFLFLHTLYIFRLPQPRSRPRDEVEKLKDVLQLVKERFSGSFSVAEAAAVAGYSPSHFMRMFRQATGRSFVEYLTNYRLDVAVHFLRETDDSITKIASECGFENESYFIRRFSQKYGVSPGRFRKRERH